MGKAAMTRRRPEPEPGPKRPFNDAFASLRDRLAEGQRQVEPEAPGKEPIGTPPPRAVVRLERKGRRGKEATVVEKLELDPVALQRLADDLKRALGCGGGIEGGALVLQGDQRDRVVRWLADRGVRKVVKG